LFRPVRFGALTLPNRIVMAPLARRRVGKGDVPSLLSSQRKDMANTLGIHSLEPMAGWRAVAEAVHAEGGPRPAAVARRTPHYSLHDGALAVEPSAVPGIPALTSTATPCTNARGNH
jgi:N-ethylmaleimide reductase